MLGDSLPFESLKNFMYKWNKINLQFKYSAFIYN